ncbi:MAG: hypothetical protein ACO4AI_10695, partial [Prochlorothrix sp.]
GGAAPTIHRGTLQFIDDTPEGNPPHPFATKPVPNPSVARTPLLIEAVGEADRHAPDSYGGHRAKIWIIQGAARQRGIVKSPGTNVGILFLILSP